jgi:methylglutaconyl-CoA hydratase
MSTLEILRPTPVVAWVWLNRPELRNAFNAALIGELGSAFAAFADDRELRCVVIGGRGKAFCAGADLAWMRSLGTYTWEQNQADAQVLADMLWTIDRCPVPVIARVHGECYAGGVGLASVADIRVAVDGAGFCLSEARLGLLPATISPYVLRALGEAASRRYFVTAERFDAATAERLGFVHERVAAAATPEATEAALDARVQALVDTIVANGPMAVRACKRLVHDFAGREITPGLRDDSARRIADIRAGAEGQEGVQAFLQRRDPTWRLP